MRVVFKALVMLALILPMRGTHAQILLTASLDGSQENPAVVTSSTGTAWVVLSADMKSLTYRVTYAQLSASRVGAHFHVGGTGGGAVVLPLSFSGNTVTGTWSSLPDSLVRHFLKGDMYVNIHSTNFPGGEIRGYFRVVHGIGFTVGLDGSQENPPNGSTATGTGWVVLDSAASQFTYDVTVAGLSGPLTGSHFHTLPSGSVVHPISFVDSTSKGTWTGLADANLDELIAGDLYVNVHSSVFPGGEIRGYLTAVEGVTFNATLDGSQENPAVVTSSTGTAWVMMSADMKSLTYRTTYAQLSAARVGAHFHVGGTGGGAVVLPLSFNGNTVTGSWTALPDSIVRHFMKGDMYVNVHSTNFPGGEIRGYFGVASGVGFTVGLDGSQENPPNGSTATGTGWAVLDSAASQFTYDVTVAGLSGPLTGSHFHTLPSGAVVHPISFVDSTSKGTWTGLADANLDELIAGDLYVNVHSSVFPGGEIRGYLMNAPSAVASVDPQSLGVASTFRLDQNYPNPFNPTTTIRFDLEQTGPVSLKVYNLLGDEVASVVQGTLTQGTHVVSFDGSRLASGVYFYHLSTAAGANQTRKMVLLK